MAGEGRSLRGQPHRNDQFARLQHRLALRGLAGQPVEFLQRHMTAALAALDLDDGVQSHQRHAEVRGMGGDAGRAPAEHGVVPVLAGERVAAGAELAPVAGAGGVVEIAATRALHDVAADRGRVAQLRRGARQQRLRYGGIGGGEGLIMREVGVAHQRADTQGAVVQPLDAVELRQAGDVDETLGACDATLHQVEQVGAAGEIGRARHRRGGNGLRKARRPDVIETVHAASLRVSAPLPAAIVRCASSTASTMPP